MILSGAFFRRKRLRRRRRLFRLSAGQPDSPSAISIRSFGVILLSARHRILNRTFMIALWIVPGAAIFAFLIFVTPLVPVTCAVYAAGPSAPVFHLAKTNDGARYKDLQQPLQISPTESMAWWQRGGSDFGEPFYEFKDRTVTHLISPGDWFTIFRRQ